MDDYNYKNVSESEFLDFNLSNNIDVYFETDSILNRYFMITDGDNNIGCFYYSVYDIGLFEECEFWLYGVYMLKPYRGNLICNKVLSVFLKQLFQKKKTLFLDCIPELEKYYSSLGFKTVETSIEKKSEWFDNPNNIIMKFI